MLYMGQFCLLVYFAVEPTMSFLFLIIYLWFVLFDQKKLSSFEMSFLKLKLAGLIFLFTHSFHLREKYTLLMRVYYSDYTPGTTSVPVLCSHSY